MDGDDDVDRSNRRASNSSARDNDLRIVRHVSQVREISHSTLSLPSDTFTSSTEASRALKR